MKSRVLMVFQKSTPFFYEILSIFVGSKKSCYANELVQDILNSGQALQKQLEDHSRVSW